MKWNVKISKSRLKYFEINVKLCFEKYTLETRDLYYATLHKFEFVVFGGYLSLQYFFLTHGFHNNLIFYQLVFYQLCNFKFASSYY